MEFKIVYPFESTIYGDSFKEAIKKFIKINHNLQINKMIVTDQTRNIQAQIKYKPLNLDKIHTDSGNSVSDI